MTDFMKVIMVLSVGSVLYTLVAPGRQTAAIMTAGGNAFQGIMKVSQGRG
ncbi:hypothetical protein [Streptomyces sp. NPDC056264]